MPKLGGIKHSPRNRRRHRRGVARITNASHRFSRDCSNVDCVSHRIGDNFARATKSTTIIPYTTKYCYKVRLSHLTSARVRLSSSPCLALPSARHRRHRAAREGGILLHVYAAVRCIDTTGVMCATLFLRVIFMQTSNNVVAAMPDRTHILRSRSRVAATR